jgi:hypothetical protein
VGQGSRIRRGDLGICGGGIWAYGEERGRRAGTNLDGAVEDAAEADAVFEDAVDLEDGVVRLVRVAVRHVVHVEHHLLHRSATARFRNGSSSGGRGQIGPRETGKGRERRGEESEASARGVGWLGGWLLAVAGDGDAVVVPPNTSRVLWSLSVLYSVKEHWRVGPDQQVSISHRCPLQAA